MLYIYISIWVILLFLFAFFLAHKINSFLPEWVLRDIQHIRWAAGITVIIITIIGAVHKLNNPALDLQVYVVFASLFSILVLFANPPIKPSEEEINRLKKELAVVREEKESLSKSLQEVAVNLSRSTKDPFQLGVAALGLGNYKNALQYLKEAESKNNLNLEKQAEIFFYEGITYWELGEHEKALATYEQAITIKPDYHEAWYNKGVVLKLLGKEVEAQKSFLKTEELNKS